jgi:hypothetical protein
MKEQQRQVYRTARGREIDMGKFTLQNELTPAVGNARVNARGDKLGPGGKIIKQKEQLQPSATPIPNQISKKDVSDMDPEGNE